MTDTTSPASSSPASSSPASDATTDVTSPSTAAENLRSQVGVTDKAAEMLRYLTKKHGPLMFHQSGGCCDGSSPMCFEDGDFLISEDGDVHLGDLDVGLERAVPVYMSTSQYEYWKHTHITIDVVKGRGAGFSVEAPEGVRFMIRSRLLTDEELTSFGLV